MTDENITVFVVILAVIKVDDGELILASLNGLFEPDRMLAEVIDSLGVVPLVFVAFHV